MRSLALAGLLAASCTTTMPPPSPHPVAASLAAAETAFAAHSVREDMRVAFLANFADDGMMARDGGWILARPYLTEHPAPPIVLDWRPAHVEVAASGEMGLSTGPWRLTLQGKPDFAPAYGQFCSVWRRGADGVWKVLVDLGTANAQPTFWDAPLALSDGPSGTAAQGSGEAAELAFAKLAGASGPRAAYARYGAPRMRFYREGHDPIVGRDASLESKAMTATGWIVEKVETARSGDFAYARGRVVGDAGRTAGYFLRVWRPVDGELRIVLDVVQPVSS